MTTNDARALLGAGHRIYVAASGGGAGLQKLLWDVPGISEVLVGCEFPYATEAMDRFLGFTPDRYCSRRTALAMALEAYYRAYRPEGGSAVGLGLTASVASTEVHRGEHRVYVATVSEAGVWVYEAILVKGAGVDVRRKDGDTCDALGLLALLEATGQSARGEDLAYEKLECAGEAMAVFLEHPQFTSSGKRERAPSNGNGLTLFPGAFNPPHDGHFWMAKENGATFHVTINPPHKPALSVADVIQRAKLLEGFRRLFTSDDPLYIDKARRFPGARILIGVDAVERMLDPRWGVEVGALVREFRQLGIRFLVADREVEGRVQTLDDVPNAPLDLCDRVLRPAQHLSMSSTKIRDAMLRGR